VWLGLHWPNSKFTIGIARSFRPNKNLHFVQVKASPSHKRRIVYHYIVYIHTYYSGYGIYIMQVAPLEFLCWDMPGVCFLQDSEPLQQTQENHHFVVRHGSKAVLGNAHGESTLGQLLLIH